MEDLQLIILAGGKGKRMGSNLPKVLLPVMGIAMLTHLLRAVRAVGLKKTPVIVTGVGSDKLRAVGGKEYLYVHQEEQRGTGHAVLCAKEIARGADHVMVLYGDHPLVDSRTIRTLANTHLKSGAVITMGTVTTKDFNDWRESFRDYGRVIRNQKGEIVRIVERKDATPEELAVTEVNPSYFCFKAEWLWEKLPLITNNNSQGEYYLTDLPALAQREGLPIASVPIRPITALGANTPEQLATLERIMREQHR